MPLHCNKSSRSRSSRTSTYDAYIVMFIISAQVRLRDLFVL